MNWFGWLTWLDHHGGAVTAMVTAIYAIFTVLLWLATKRQATLTQRIFEASNRPYVSLHMQEHGPKTLDVVSFTVLIQNVGSVPAKVIKWEVSATLMGLDPVEQVEGQKVLETLVGACLFPSRDVGVCVEFQRPGLLQQQLPIHVVMTMKYRGISEPFTGPPWMRSARRLNCASGRPRRDQRFCRNSAVDSAVTSGEVGISR